MQRFSRRELFGRTAAACAAAGALGAFPLRANPLGLPIGFQTYPIRKEITEDFAGTLRKMAELGYQSVEMCSPPGYGDFAALRTMKPASIRQTIKHAGLKCESCHYTPTEIKENLDDRIAYAKELGLKQMILSMFSLRPDFTLDDWKREADGLNKAGEKVQQAGMQLGYHNHHFEFKKFGDVLVYDELLKVFDPKLVKLQFQVAVVSLGYNAADYLEKYPGRFISLHLADWSSETKKNCAVGKGVVDWPKLFAAAKKAKIKNYFVEVDMDALKESAPYLRNLKA